MATSKSLSFLCLIRVFFSYGKVTKEETPKSNSINNTARILRHPLLPRSEFFARRNIRRVNTQGESKVILCDIVFINKKLVKPDKKILDEIEHLPFDYYQIYDCKPNEIEKIKKNYNKKIILALTIQNSKDIEKFKLYENYADIFLFDGKGYEKSISFNHSLLNNFKFNKEVMLAGNIQINDNLENYKKIADIIDISGGVETSGLKDISKLEIFLQNIKKIKDEA